jgi:hypothetical protein
VLSGEVQLCYITWLSCSCKLFPLSHSFRLETPAFSVSGFDMKNISYCRCSGIELGYRLDDRGFESRHGLRIFLLTTASRPFLRPTQSPIQCVPGALSIWIKPPGREIDHSPLSGAEVNAWSYTSTPQYASMG